MNSPAESLVVALLAAWFGVSVAYQLFLRRLMPVMARWDVFRVVPSWHLYTSFPRDLRLWYRDRDAHGDAGVWREVRVVRSRRWHRAIWNPDLLEADALFSFTEQFVELLESQPPLAAATLPQRTPARALWLAVAAQPHLSSGGARQFEVREQSLTVPGEPRVLYTSAFVPLADGGTAR